MRAALLLATFSILMPVISAQEMPDGKGKDLVTTQCASCHGLEQVVAHRDSKDGWENVVQYMISRGMSATDDEVKIIIDYLAASYPTPPAPPKPTPAKGKAK